ncbi:hypothetical protein [Roseateles saccharophilus]|uniref:Extracellular solute-binding protein (Family 3) n=1 Tax=Roseateles saccharophilus TaxID=304 RepID=A0A4R3VA81_ROSSA|nr:hypothetical protein [Roseateles saccharophilus]MDG0831654.1 hypothetical protein [Roseateles saccharophilus]TCV00931.1 hypothetical protein EV671_100760 [Roseateles saccharophilus]
MLRPAPWFRYAPLLLPLLPALCGAAEPAALRVVIATTSPTDYEAGQRAVAIMMHQAGLSYTLTQEPPERAVASLKAGLYDVDIARVDGFDKDVPGALRVDPPLGTVVVRAYGRRPLPAPVPVSLAGLARYRIAHVHGQRAVEYQLPKGGTGYPVATPSACLGMAAAGRVDYCVLASLSQAEANLPRGPLQAQVINQLPFYIWVGPGHGELARRLGEALRGAIASGDIDRALLGEPAH